MKSQDFQLVMNKVADALQSPGGVPSALFNAALIAAADMEQRVHQRGQTITGQTLQYKSDQYKKKRTKAGRQTGHKDFQMTDNLFNSLSILEAENKRVVYGFSSNETAQVAEYVTDQIGLEVKDIWGLSDEERRNATKEFTNGVARVINSTIKTGTKQGIRRTKVNRKPSVKPYVKNKRK